jgi:hypothetical protein
LADSRIVFLSLIDDEWGEKGDSGMRAIPLREPEFAQPGKPRRVRRN